MWYGLNIERIGTYNLSSSPRSLRTVILCKQWYIIAQKLSLKRQYTGPYKSVIHLTRVSLLPFFVFNFFKI